MNSTVKNMISRINKRDLTNNTQRVLFALLTSKSEWVPVSQVRVPSAASRIRDLRTKTFGQFRVECSTRSTDPKVSARNVTAYRLDPASVTVSKITRVFEGVISK